MGQVLGGYQHQVVIPDFFHAVSHYSPHALCVLDEIEFVFLVFVKRIGEFAFVPLHNVEAVLLGKLGNFVQDISHRSNFSQKYTFFFKTNTILTIF